MADLVLLCALLRGPAHGYSLKRTAGLIFGDALHNDLVYPALRKFTRQGWVEQSSAAGERGQERKQYRITAEGTKCLLARLAEFSGADAADESAFLLRIAFFDLLAPATHSDIVRAHRAVLTAQAARLKELRGTHRPGDFPALALQRALDRAAAELRWIRRIESRLREGDQNGRRKNSLGYDVPVLSFLAQRSAETHAAFFLQDLRPGSDTGVDNAEAQFAPRRAVHRGIPPGERV